MLYDFWAARAGIRGAFLAIGIFFFSAIMLAGYATQAEAVRPYSEIKVILYMTDWCYNCMHAREHLKSLGVQLVEYNVEKDKDKEWESIEKSGRRGVPVIDIEGIIIYGYISERVTGAVEMKRNQ